MQAVKVSKIKRILKRGVFCLLKTEIAFAKKVRIENWQVV